MRRQMALIGLALALAGSGAGGRDLWVIKSATYEPTDPTIDSQIVSCSRPGWIR
jgi:hypothetical protein